MLPRDDFDFAHEPSGARRIGIVLVVVGLALAADVARSFVSDRSRLDTLTVRAAHLPRHPHLEDLEAPRPIKAEEWAAARDVLGALATPWNGLFAPLEAVMPKDVTLGSLEPDPKTRTVVITGNAKDYLSILNYVEALRAGGSLREVRLTHHDTNTITRRINFSIFASWSGN